MLVFWLVNVILSYLPMFLFFLSIINNQPNMAFLLAFIFSSFILTNILFSFFSKYQFFENKVTFSCFGLKLFMLNWDEIVEFQYGNLFAFRIFGNRAKYGLYFKTIELKTKSNWVHVLPRANFAKVFQSPPHGL
jgi:hypothetical protein